MFRQLVTPPPVSGGTVVDNINSLFAYHPLQISAIVETVWLNRYNPASSPFPSWPPQITFPILNADFFQGYAWPAGGGSGPPMSPLPYVVRPLDQPGIAGTTLASPSAPTNWDQLIYGYIIECTRIYQIFSKVLETYMFSEELEVPSPRSQLFWRNLEFLIYGDAVPSMLWPTSGRARRDEVANRLTTYYRMFGIDLPHAAELVGQHPYQKPAAANRDFIPTFEAFGREVWRGIVNAKNTSGANNTDPTVIATLAQRIYDMMATRRLSGNLSREEFRIVSLMSFLDLAVSFDSTVVVDLKAAAADKALRLHKIAERVGMTAHFQSKPFFDLAAPFSILMQSIESGVFNDTSGAQLLYSQIPPNDTAQNAETVIDQYSLATGRDLKSDAVTLVSRATTLPLSLAKRQAPPPRLAVQRVDGQAVSKQ